MEGAEKASGVNAEKWEPIYQREDDWTTHRYELTTSNVLRFAAKDVRKERTGIHANVMISLNWVLLSQSNFNVERDEDRVRLANSAYGHLEGEAHSLDRAEFPKNLFKHALDIFCIGLWEETVSADVGGILPGDPTVPPARRMLGDFVLDEASTILFAPPGAGKSYTALAWADCLAWGVEDIWPVHVAAVPLYINVERSATSMQGRLARVNTAFGLDPEAGIPFLNARGKGLADIYEAAKRTIKQERCTVVFYDSISRAGFGSLVNDDTANKTCDMLNALCPTWVALAHSPRADDSHAFGSQMFDAAADLTVQLRAQTSSDGYSTGVSLQVIKANDLRKPPQSVHVLEWDEDGLRRIRRGRQGEFGELEAGERLGLEEEVSRLLKKNGAMSPTAIAEELGKQRPSIARLVSNSDRFVRVGPAGLGAKVLYGLKT